MRVYFILAVFLINNSLGAQICNGILGDNIFKDGDFGSGTSPVVTVDPKIAPGYNYRFSGPPNDGFYTLTNNSGAIPGLFSTWLQIGDNSSDPNGYFMLVNASYAPGDFYKQTITDLCENTKYVFSADVINIVRTPVPNHIFPNVSFLLNDSVYYTSGGIPQDEKWKTYGFVFTTAPGQTDLVLTLRNNAPGGIGNDLGIDNITFKPCGPASLVLFENETDPNQTTLVSRICEDGNAVKIKTALIGDEIVNPAIQWQESRDGGLSWSNIPNANDSFYIHNKLQAGRYFYRFILAKSPSELTNEKCRFISAIKIIEVNPKFVTVADTLCEGGFYPFSGIYIDTLLSSLGCDSIVTRQIEVVPDPGIAPILEFQDPNCYQDSTGWIIIQDALFSYPPYQVFLDEKLLDPANLSGLKAGNYFFKIIDHFGCDVDTIVELFDPDPFVVSISGSDSIELGDRFEIGLLPTYPIQNVRINPDKLLTFNPLLNVIEGFPANSENFQLRFESIFGCIFLTDIPLKIVNTEKVYIPNIFSPNGDGINDIFSVLVKKEAIEKIESFMIFSRWGEKILDHQNIPPNDPLSSWDGFIRGNSAPEGVYVYSVKVVYINQQTATYSGHFNLIR